MRARLIRPEDPSLLLHNHIAHSFPPTKDGCVGGADETHVVLPVVLADSSPEVLKPMLDKHLGYLVDEWFQDFPLYDSRLTVLGWIWTVYQQLEEVCRRRSLFFLTFTLIRSQACTPRFDAKDAQAPGAGPHWRRYQRRAKFPSRGAVPPFICC